MNHSTTDTTGQQDRQDQPAREWAAGDEIHGFANGYFGRDSYACRVVEAVGPDWLITRNAENQVEHISKADVNQIDDPMDPNFCRCNYGIDDVDRVPCDIKGEIERERQLRTILDEDHA